MRQAHGPQPDVRQRDDDRAVALEQIEIRAQYADGPGQMLEHVGEDDGVEAAAADGAAHVVDVGQVGLDDLLDALPRLYHRLAAGLDADHAFGAALDVLRGGGEAEARIEDVAIATVAQ